jgi:hypothetical protein
MTLSKEGGMPACVRDEERRKGRRVDELRGASRGDNVFFLLKKERRVFEGIAAAFLTFSRCAELVMCAFQFISPAKLSPTSVLHSGQ